MCWSTGHLLVERIPRGKGLQILTGPMMLDVLALSRRMLLRGINAYSAAYFTNLNFTMIVGDEKNRAMIVKVILQSPGLSHDYRGCFFRGQL